MRNDKERLLDAYLAAAARTGDRRALSRLVERWQPKFLGHAYRLTGEAELAADMAQEARVEVIRGIDRLEDAAAFPAWAMRIVSRRCTQAIRRRQGGLIRACKSAPTIVEKGPGKWRRPESAAEPRIRQPGQMPATLPSEVYDGLRCPFHRSPRRQAKRVA